jgi:hypothetical protein
LQIEGKGSWRNRLSNLGLIKEVFPGGNQSIEKLIFLIVNTVNGAMT